MEIKKPDKIQKREIVVREYEDGTYELIGSVWNLDKLSSNEVEEAFIAWKRKELKEECSLEIKLPKMFSN